MSKNKQIDITQKITKDLDSAVQITSEILGRQIEKAYRDAISKFYSDRAFPYSRIKNKPLRYKRRETNNLYYGSSGRIRYNKNKPMYKPIGDVYRTGIEVGAEFYTNPSPYRADTEWVFNRAFVDGVHGFCEGDNFIWDMTVFGNRKVHNIPLRATAEFTPKEIMDRKFKNISDKENITKILAHAFKRKLQGH